MASNPNVERLTPLDVLMPRTYIGVLLTFSTTEPSSSIIPRLQGGLDTLAKQVPWLSGKVVPATADPGHKPSLEIQWGANDDPLKVVDKGQIPDSYEKLRDEGMSPVAFPDDLWPAPGMVDDALFEKGAPVFAANLFRFADGQGVGLTMCMHHNALDATAFTEILRLWTQNIAGIDSPSISVPHRLRLTDALSPHLPALASESDDSLLGLHPEYTTTPHSWPTEFPPCTSKIFTTPITQINRIKELLQNYMPTAPTTNTLICALMWSAVSRARLQRNSAYAREPSRLAMAVNGRRRISEGFSTSDDPYLGNVVLCSLAELTIDNLSQTSGPDRMQSLANLCQSIAQSQSSDCINFRCIAEVYRLVDHVDDYRSVLYSFDLFCGRDLMITSWAGLDLYGMDFGPGLRKPDFMRVPHAPVDGLGLVLPRRRTVGHTGESDEMLEFMFMLRCDDMEWLEKDSLWEGIARADK